MFEQLEMIKQKYLNLQNKMLQNNNYLKDVNFLKKFRELEKIVEVYNQYLQLKEEEEEIQQILKSNQYQNDADLLLLGQEEYNVLQQKRNNILEKLQMFFLSKEENDEKNIIMEIKGAVGGDEANLFVADLFRAYTRYAESQKWKIEIINLIPGLKNGISFLMAMIYGKELYSFFKYESGVHRVQRVPLTEKQGRIQTSTIKVLITPNVEKTQIELNWNDIRIDTFNASGPGGQSVNTTKSAVRLTHLPTSISIACQIAKSQHQNKEKAFQLLKNKIFYHMSSQEQQIQNDIKKNLIGKGERSEKIRTYNYVQNRVTDHRYNLTLQKLDLFMEGKIDLLIKPLIMEFNKKQIQTKIRYDY
ncbi:peptide chain release factor 1 [Candidatus Phytoplasma phoenicium]|uniref:peptide chain release factor 1 n=1 Tax=Candidatus Phytoplasma phoenicium TaxID=198422 RepID=UPI00067BBACA|nr:peptide chain release factor 1 [Candidatus Phytoplasma phoenicium]